MEPVVAPRAANAAEAEGYLLTLVYRGEEQSQRSCRARRARHRARTDRDGEAAGARAVRLPRQLAGGRLDVPQRASLEDAGRQQRDGARLMQRCQRYRHDFEQRPDAEQDLQDNGRQQQMDAVVAPAPRGFARRPANQSVAIAAVTM